MINKVVKHLRQGTPLIILRKKTDNVLDLISKKLGYKRKKGSLAYRNNKRKILKGDFPKKYTRLLPYIPGDSILEIGSAEGVLALLLCQSKDNVLALELSPERNKEALKLQSIFRDKGYRVDNCRMLEGNIDDRIDLLEQVDTVVAVRVIYHLDDVKLTFSRIAKKIENVVLCGNKYRAEKYYKGSGNKKNYYATLEGMKTLLEDCGYEIKKTLKDGDPIVVGSKVLTD